MSLQIHEDLLRSLMSDPVLAAKVLMGIELDDYQAAALRLDWWFQETIDSSGVSTGKTMRIFVLACLRCMLIPNHVCAVYFPSFQMGKEEFWPYFQATMDRSPIFRQQLLVDRNREGEKKMPGAWLMYFKNGSRLTMPAPGFLTDSKTAAGRRFNTLIVDDWLKAMEMGDGIDQQLVDRCTRPCFNQEHPVWGNHIHFKGHAQRPSHKGYKRVRAYKRLILDGSMRHAVYAFCYKDISPKFAKLIRPDNTIRTQKAVLPPDQFARQWLGLWARDGSTYYPEVVIEGAMRGDTAPSFGRMYEDEINIGGQDIAPGQSIRADYSALAVLRIVELKEGRTRSVIGQWVTLPVTFRRNGRQFNVAYTYAFALRNKSGPETSGFIHFMHRLFGFSLFILDPGGGGLWVYKELKKDVQEIEGQVAKVVPLCTQAEPLAVDKLAIIHFFGRSEDQGQLRELVEPDYLRGEEGFLAAMHLRFREAWEAQEFVVPLALDRRPPAEVARWRPEVIEAQKCLEVGCGQLANVRQLTNAEGHPLTSKRGFALFGATGKKDIAYAMFYAFCGTQLWFHLFADGAAEEEEEGESYFTVG